MKIILCGYCADKLKQFDNWLKGGQPLVKENCEICHNTMLPARLVDVDFEPVHEEIFKVHHPEILRRP